MTDIVPVLGEYESEYEIWDQRNNQIVNEGGVQSSSFDQAPLMSRASEDSTLAADEDVERLAERTLKMMRTKSRL